MELIPWCPGVGVELIPWCPGVGVELLPWCPGVGSYSSQVEGVKLSIHENGLAIPATHQQELLSNIQARFSNQALIRTPFPKLTMRYLQKVQRLHVSA